MTRIVGDLAETIGRGRVPSVRVVVTSGCPLRCGYCPTAGDAGELKKDCRKLTTREIFKIIDIGIEKGFYHWSISGGEPTTDPDKTIEIIDYLHEKLGDRGYIRLNTNGIGLTQDFVRNIEGKVGLLKVSIDSLKTCTGKLDCNFSERNRNFGKKVLGNLDFIKNIPIRVHSVFTKENIDEFDSLFEYFVLEKGYCWKPYEVSYYDENLGGISFREWRDNVYVSLGSKVRDFEKRFGCEGEVYSVGKNGNPMPTFVVENFKEKESIIKFRTIGKGAHYFKNEICEKCDVGLCADGASNITVHPNGGLKGCRPKDGYVFWFLEDELNLDRVREVFDELKYMYLNNKFVERKIECLYKNNV